MVKFLLARKIDINAVNAVGETALGIAKRMGNASIVQLLRQAGATALSASDSSFNVAVASGTNTDS
jgi:ankyrin repeat protein